MSGAIAIVDYGMGNIRSVINALREVRFVQIDDDEQRLCGQKLKAAQPLQVVALQVQRAQRPSVFERRFTEQNHLALAFEVG